MPCRSTSPSTQGQVTIRQVADGIKWDSGGRSAYRITTVLKQLGYTYGRTCGSLASRRRYWTPPVRVLIDDPDPGEDT